MDGVDQPLEVVRPVQVAELQATFHDVLDPALYLRDDGSCGGCGADPGRGLQLRARLDPVGLQELRQLIQLHRHCCRFADPLLWRIPRSASAPGTSPTTGEMVACERCQAGHNMQTWGNIRVPCSATGMECTFVVKHLLTSSSAWSLLGGCECTAGCAWVAAKVADRVLPSNSSILHTQRPQQSGNLAWLS